MLKSLYFWSFYAMMQQRTKPGFSLLELVCCLCLLGLLVSYRFLYYSDAILKVHRSDAKLSLEHWAAKLEQHKGIAKRLKEGVSSLEGFYRIRLVSNGKGSYFLEARPIHRQVRDHACPVFRLSSSGTLYSAADC